MRAPAVIVIGAGAAGLAAAEALDRAGLGVLLLEARRRVGGRIWPRRDPLSGAPVELGAEFIHGEAPATRQIVERGGGAVLDAPRDHWIRRARTLVPMRDVFGRLERAMASRAILRGRDASFEDLLRDMARRGVAPDVRRFARMLVEGFDAADTRLASARAVAEEWSGGNAADAPQFRPLGGHAALLQALGECTRPGRVRLARGHVVRTVRWRAGHVEVEGLAGDRPFRVAARRAVITLPLGVLQAEDGAPGAVRFDPELASKAPALRLLAPGAVVKVVLRFREPFWERLGQGRCRDAAFFHAPRAAFPTLWTSLPLRTATLVAWSGGPRAQALAGEHADVVIGLALASVRATLGSRAVRRSELVAAHVHDWSRDPFARGAYSYVKVGGGSARATLARPLRGTLYFAGEATDTEDAGTVEGALRSGHRVAQQILRAVR